MRKLALALSLAVFGLSMLPARLMAQDKPGPNFTVTYDFSTRDMVTGTDLNIRRTITDFLGFRKFNVDVFPLLGASTSSSLGNPVTMPTIGGTLAAPVSFGSNLPGWLGLGGRFQSGQKPHLYFFAGWKF